MARVEISTVVDEGGEIPALILVGEFDQSNYQLLDDILTLWIAQGRSEAVLDMRQTTFASAAVLESLANARRAGLTIIVRGARGAVRRTIEAGGMDDLLVDLTD